MDKIKKYLKENEEHLSIDKIGDNVWLNIHEAIKPKRTFLSVIKTPFLTAEKFFTKKGGRTYGALRPNYNRWAFAILLPVLFIFSCTYRVNRIEVIGDIISFNINNSAVQKINILQGRYRFKALEYKNSLNEGLLSFISFVERKAEKAEAITTYLKQVPTINQLEITPVSAKINESLFSAFVHKTFKVHVDARRIDNEELEKNILLQLKKKGFGNVKVEIGKNGEVQLSNQDSLPVLAVDKVDVKIDSTKLQTDLPPSDIHVKAIQKDTFITIIANKDTANPEPKEEAKPVPEINREPLPNKADEQWLINTSLKPGTWKGFITGNLIKIYLKDPNYNEIQFSGWALTRRFTLKEASLSNPQGESQFSIKRDAGVITFTGAFAENRGQGKFLFEQNTAFKSHLLEKGFKNINDEFMLLSFLNNINNEYLDYLKENGYENISTDQLEQLARHALTLAHLQDYIEFFKEYNYEHVKLDRLIRLNNHGVNASFIKSFIQLGYKDISLNDAQSLKDHGVSAAFIKSFEELGYKNIPLATAQGLADHQVSAAFIKSFEELGYKNISLSMAQRMKDRGVYASYIKGFIELGFNNLSLDTVVRLKDRGLTPAFIKQMKEKGKNNLTIDEYLRLKEGG
jgi:hypothetical protein